MVELTKEWVNLAVKEVIRAKEVKDGPIFENIVDGDKVDTFCLSFTQVLRAGRRALLRHRSIHGDSGPRDR